MPPVPRLRAALSAIPAYRPGRAPAGGDGPSYKLSSNENPYPPLPSVLEVLAGADRDINRYPDMFATDLVRRLAAQHGLGPEQVVCGTGSVGVLGQVVQATCEAGDEVVFAWRSFEAYPIVVGVSGATAVRVPLGPDGRHDLPAMAAAVTDRTRLLLVCSPNNPTGPAVRARRCGTCSRPSRRTSSSCSTRPTPSSSATPTPSSGRRCSPTHDNLVVLRTFSKAYGLASLRVGYALAHPLVADALRATAVPFGVSGPAQAAALASLDAEGELLERVDRLVVERERLRAALAAVGWTVPEPQGNFVWLACGDRTTAVVEACEAAGVTVRGFAGEGVRCSVGTAEADDLLVRTVAPFAPAR